ncbi:unnamed protein product, partial [marine sediment metagenome]
FIIKYSIKNREVCQENQDRFQSYASLSLYYIPGYFYFFLKLTLVRGEIII